MVKIETLRGTPVPAGNRVLVPVSRSVRVELPGRRGGLVWNRPIGLWIESDSPRRFLPIADDTRRWQWLLLSVGVAVGFVLLLAGRRRRPRRETWGR